MNVSSWQFSKLCYLQIRCKLVRLSEISTVANKVNKMDTSARFSVFLFGILIAIKCEFVHAIASEERESCPVITKLLYEIIGDMHQLQIGQESITEKIDKLAGNTEGNFIRVKPAKSLWGLGTHGLGLASYFTDILGTTQKQVFQCYCFAIMHGCHGNHNRRFRASNQHF